LGNLTRSGRLASYIRSTSHEMNQTKILITGANGQLGKELTQFFNKDYEVNALSEYDLDITNFKKVKSSVTSFHPDIIINAAAYTLVDDCETNIEIAYKVNALGVRNLSIIANSTGATLVHFSTDYVFNGEKSSPYTEFDIPKPLSIYGKSKYEGEKLLQSLHNKYFLVRISWLYSPYGNNFVKNILKLASQKKNLRIVNDQTGTPTFTKDVANQLKVLLNTEKYGLYHLTNQGECSWHDFSKNPLLIKVPPTVYHGFKAIGDENSLFSKHSYASL